MTAKIADTIDEISGGRYVLGIGAGNTEDSDYEAFGFPTDRRYSRFAEAIQIIHGLLKNCEIDFEGEFYTAKQAELVLRGLRPQGPPINIAAGGPKMLRLVARYADAWNWWAWGETLEQINERLGPIIDVLEQMCETEGREKRSGKRNSPTRERSGRRGGGGTLPTSLVSSPVGSTSRSPVEACPWPRLSPMERQRSPFLLSFSHPRQHSAPDRGGTTADSAGSLRSGRVPGGSHVW